MSRYNQAMDANIIVTLTGRDRIGLVEEITGVFLSLGGNVETSRMVRLGGDFAMLMLVTLPAGNADKLTAQIAALTAQGYTVVAHPTETAVERADWTAHAISVTGADHEGIIHEFAHALAQRGVNIESMDTGVSSAPNSGAPLFSMRAQVLAPPSVMSSALRAELDQIGRRVNVDVEIS
jgi:glycine cleavage system transcriptional repressor